MTANVVSAVNRKGGVGKTSSVFHLAGCFAEQGNKVLVIDNDPQHSLTTGIFGPQLADNLDPDQTIAALYDDKYDPEPSELVVLTPFENMSIICGSDALTEFNYPNPNDAGSLQLSLKDFVEEVREDFDLILIDNPPNLQLLTWASLTASDYALTISQPEDYGAQGCVAVQKAVDEVLQTSNSSLKFAGYVLNMVNKRLSIHKAYEELLRELYDDQVFDTKLPLSVHFKEAIAARMPVTQYKSNSVAANAIQSLADELIDRMDQLEGEPAEFQYAGNKFPNGLQNPNQPEA